MPAAISLARTNVARPRAVLISQNLAERLWPAQSPLGRTLVVNKQEREVVGVTPNLFFSGFRREHPGFVLLPAQQDPLEPGEATLYVRYSGGLDTIGPAITRALRQVDATDAGCVHANLGHAAV